MNYRMTARLIAIVLRFVALFMLPALVISLILGETGAVWGLLITMAVMALLSCLPLPFPPRRQTMYARDGFVVVAMTWFLISLLGALPFWISGAIPNYVDCVFETVSGFTTTGASILTDVEALPKGLLYWRSFTHWAVWACWCSCWPLPALLPVPATVCTSCAPNPPGRR